MAPPIAPEIVIAPPIPATPRHSLLRVGEDLLKWEGDDTEIAAAIGNRWEAGVQFLPEGCGEGGIFVPCSDDYATMTGDTASGIITAIPIVAWAPWECSSWSRKAIDFKGRAKRKLESVASHHLAEEFWRGTASNTEGLGNPYLADPLTMVDVNPGSSSTPLTYALGLLQDAIGDCSNGGEGVIHATRSLVNLWYSAKMIERKEDSDGTIRFFDIYGNAIIADSGYDGSDGTGTVDATGDTQWAYATGPVGVAAGDVIITPDDESEALDRGANLITYYAQRSVLATWDLCCHFGINVNLCSTCCTSPLIG